MTTDPNDIHLTQEDKEVLATLVDESGKDLSVALREAVTTYLEGSAPASESNGVRGADIELSLIHILTLPTILRV